jgi:hypothetical protein
MVLTLSFVQAVFLIVLRQLDFLISAEVARNRRKKRPE